MRQVRVDFGGERGGRVTCRREQPNPLTLGEIVLARDDDGTERLAVVEAMRPSHIILQALPSAESADWDRLHRIERPGSLVGYYEQD